MSDWNERNLPLQLSFHIICDAAAPLERGPRCTSKLPGFLPKDTQNTIIISDWDVFAFSQFQQDTKVLSPTGDEENWKEDREFQDGVPLCEERDQTQCLSVWHISNRMCIYLYSDGYEGLQTQNGMWFN